MPGQYVITQIVGSGTTPDPYRAAAGDVPGVDCNAAITTDPVTGKPANVKGWTVAYVVAPDLTPVMALASVNPFPQGLTLDSVLTGAQRNTLTQWASTYYGGTITLANGSTLRDGINAMIRTLDPTFSVDQLFLPDRT